MSTIHGFPHHARVRAANGRRIDVKAVLGLPDAGCYGNCNQGRRACTLPGVCAIRSIDRHTLSSLERGAMVEGDFADTMPVVPVPAEACTELGVEGEIEPARNVRLRRNFWLAYLGGLAFAALWLWLR